MIDPSKWKPTHDRSQESGKMRNRCFEGEGEDEARGAPIEYVSSPDSYFGEAPEDDSDLTFTGNRGDRDLLKKIFDILDDDPPETMAVRLNALKYRYRIGAPTLRESAKKARCGLATICRAVRKLEHLFKR